MTSIDTSASAPDSAAFQLNPRYRLQWEEAQQSHVLLYPEGMVKLNGSAAEILRHCQHPTTAAQLLATLRTAFPDAPASLADDVREFLLHARQQEWILPPSEEQQP